MILLIGSALLANLHLFQQTAALNPEPLGRDKIAQYEKRFEGLKKILPAHGVVGYISNKQAEDIRFDVTAVEYYLTQYALTPVIVVYSTEPQLVVGNFHGPSIAPGIFARRNLILVRDFGNGVMLFRNVHK